MISWRMFAGDAYHASANALEESAAGSPVICDIVYAELCIHFASRHECDEFLESDEIRVQALTREAHFSQAALAGSIDKEESEPGFCRTF